MVVSDITGGLGNQMFQYAAGYALAKKNNDSFKVDISHLTKDYQKASKVAVPREYQLEQFEVSANILPTLHIPEHNKLQKGIGRLYRYFRMGSLLGTKFILDQDAWEYQPDLMQQKGSVYLCGFWQSWKYFDSYRDDIRKEFQIKKDALSEKAWNLIHAGGNTVGIHIRRGDYKLCDNWLIEASFYTKALKVLKKKHGEDMEILVFCDEGGFAEQLFQDEKNIRYITASKEFSDFEEFAVLSGCKHHIISNSTFSWWAAYLGEQQCAEVIAPVFRQWKDAYYPDNWIKIDMN